MSGAQWSPERLLNHAAALEARGAFDFAFEVAALRAFASVVSVLERATWPDSVQISVVPSGIRARLGVVAVEADTPLAAILTLADALDALGGGT